VRIKVQRFPYQKYKILQGETLENKWQANGFSNWQIQVISLQTWNSSIFAGLVA